MVEETDQVAHLNAPLAERYGLECELGRGGVTTGRPAEDFKHATQVALRPEIAAGPGFGIWGGASGEVS